MRDITAVIPIRAGSQRVKNKNLRSFSEKSLLEYKLDVIQTLGIKNVVVNTDSEQAIQIAKEYGVEFHRREPYYASSECSGSEYFEYLAKVTESEHLLIAPVTAPLIERETFIDAMECYFENDCDSLMSVKSLKEFIWHEGTPVNYNPKNAPNSQDLPNYLALTFGLVIAQRETMLLTKNVIGLRPYFYQLDEVGAVDIDTQLDFEFAEFLFNKYRINGRNVGPG